MGYRNGWRFRALAASMLASAVAALGASGCSDEGDVPVAQCESTRTYFAKHVWQIVESKCIACHNPAGQAKDTEYILKSSAEAGFLDHNVEVIRNVASLEREGKSIWLLKPSNDLGTTHEGGLVIPKGSDDYKAMLGLVARLKAGETCDEVGGGEFTGVELADEEATLRKASILLVGRLPSLDEIQRVQEGGFPALQAVLDEMMTEQAFFDFITTIYGDLFQTDFYLRNQAAGQISDIYANAFWYEEADKSVIEQYGLLSADELSEYTEVGIAREPLALVEWVVKNDLPFTEIVTADYMMFTPLSAQSYGAEGVEFENPNDPMEFAPGRLPSYSFEGDPEVYDFPHAGVLTSPMFLNRWPTTPTNRNRARARVVLQFFLGTDILKTADQPVDQTKVDSLNPTREAEDCTVCHAVIDPIAGTFQAFDEDGIWSAEPEWYPEMFPPGFKDSKLSLDQSSYGLQWLAPRLAADERFPLGVVQIVYKGLTGRDPLVAPSDYADPGYDAQFNSFLAQSNTFEKIADDFVASGYNIKAIVKGLVMSPYFRGVNSVPLDQHALDSMKDVGMGRFLPPEHLHRKIAAIMEIPWGSVSDPYLVSRPRDIDDTGRFQLLYGGVDHVDATVRITDPNGLMAAVAERMANQMSCWAVPRDFHKDTADRILFPEVELSDGDMVDPLALEPEASGLPVPEAVNGIKKAIVHLHQHILGERLTVSDPEVERTYQLFLETWQEGQDLIAEPDNGFGEGLPWQCRVTEDYWTGVDYAEEDQLTQDPNYNIRAWMAVTSYLVSDWKFLTE